MKKSAIVIAVLAAAALLVFLLYSGPDESHSELYSETGGSHLESDEPSAVYVPAATTEEFDEIVASGVTLVDFWAEWCGPCRRQAPIVSDVARQVAERAKVVKVNTDEEPALADRFNVRAIPALIVFKDGEPVERFSGVQTAATLLRAIDGAAADEEL